MCNLRKELGVSDAKNVRHLSAHDPWRMVCGVDPLESTTQSGSRLSDNGSIMSVRELCKPVIVWLLFDYQMGKCKLFIVLFDNWTP